MTEKSKKSRTTRNKTPDPIMIDPSVELLLEEDLYKKIEIAGRTYCKSEDKLTTRTSRRFVRNLIKNQHTSVLEHSYLVFEIMFDTEIPDVIFRYLQILLNDKYLEVSIDMDIPRILVSGNIRSIRNRGTDVKPEYCNDPIYRAMLKMYPEFASPKEEQGEAIYTQIEANIIDITKLKNITEYEFKKHFRLTAKFIIDRGTAHEITMHRSFSFTQEPSTYTGYSVDQPENRIVFCKPSTYDSWAKKKQTKFKKLLSTIESSYIDLVSTSESVLTAEQAQAIVPNALRTELIVSGPAHEWIHFFNLKSRELTGSVHPDIKCIADKCLLLMNDYIKSLNYEEELYF